MNVCAYLHGGPYETGRLLIDESLVELLLPVTEPRMVPAKFFDQDAKHQHHLYVEEHLYREKSRVGSEAEFEYVGIVE